MTDTAELIEALDYATEQADVASKRQAKEFARGCRQGDLSGERWHARQEAFIEMKIKLSAALASIATPAPTQTLREQCANEDDDFRYVAITGPGVDALDCRKESDNGPSEEQVTADTRVALDTLGPANFEGFRALREASIALAPTLWPPVAGKIGLMRDGRRVANLRRDADGDWLGDIVGGASNDTWNSDGSYFFASDKRSSDLVARADEVVK